MHQMRKTQQGYFGTTMHIGVDSSTGLGQSAVVTAANIHDKHPLPDWLHGNKQRAYSDSALIATGLGIPLKRKRHLFVVFSSQDERIFCG